MISAPMSRLTTWLMGIRSAMVCRRRSQALAGGGGGAGAWGHPGGGETGALSCDTDARMEGGIDVPMPSSDPELERLRKQASVLPLGARIIRAVASSTAIETGQPVAEIERALTDRQSTQATPA